MKTGIIKYLSLIALLICTAWLTKKPGWESSSGFITSLITFVGTDIIILKPNEHDKQLYLKFLENFPSNGQSLIFLKDQDMAGPFRGEELKELDDFLYLWDNAEHEFKNKKMEKTKSKLLRLAKTFRGDLSLSIFPIRSAPGFFSMDLDDFETRPEKLKKQDELNKKASEVFVVHQELVRIGKKLILE